MFFYFNQAPQQKNEYDSGLFVLFYMERFIKDAPERIKKKDLSMVYIFLIVFLHFNLHFPIREIGTHFSTETWTHNLMVNGQLSYHYSIGPLDLNLLLSFEHNT